MRPITAGSMVDDSTLLILGATSALTVYQDSNNQWLYANWHGIHEVDTAAQSAQLLIDCVKAYPYRKLLNNTQQVTSGWDGREQWAGETLFSSLAQLGVCYIACVYSKQWLARYSLDRTLEYATQPFIVSFEDLATACNWLQQIR